jgi:hypothetical protein
MAATASERSTPAGGAPAKDASDQESDDSVPARRAHVTEQPKKGAASGASASSDAKARASDGPSWTAEEIRDSNDSLFMFAFPARFDVRRFSTLRLSIPSEPLVEGGLVCEFVMEKRKYALLESPLAETRQYVNLFPTKDGKELHPGKPFARFFTVMPASPVPDTLTVPDALQPPPLQIVDEPAHRYHAFGSGAEQSSASPRASPRRRKPVPSGHNGGPAGSPPASPARRSTRPAESAGVGYTHPRVAAAAEASGTPARSSRARSPPASPRAAASDSEAEETRERKTEKGGDEGPEKEKERKKKKKEKEKGSKRDDDDDAAAEVQSSRKQRHPRPDKDEAASSRVKREPESESEPASSPAPKRRKREA